MIRFIHAFFLSLFGLVSIANAQPSITNATGIFENGQSIDIAGTGFGTKSHASPCLFDRVENMSVYSEYSDDDAIEQNSVWGGTSVSTYNTTSGDQRGTSTANYRSESSAYNYVDGYTIGTAPSKIYISWWCRNSIISPNSDNKYLRLGEGGQGDEHLVNYTSSWTGDASYIYYNSAFCTPTPPGTGNAYWESTTLSANTWHRLEALYDVSGQTWTLIVDNTTIANGISYTCNYQPNYVWKVGFDTDVGWHPTTLLDDIYIDSSFLRVEIGNHSTHSSCTHIENQLATSWSATSIAITLNTGSFGASDSIYFFVHSADNTVSAGYGRQLGGAVAGIGRKVRCSGSRP